MFVEIVFLLILIWMFLWSNFDLGDGLDDVSELKHVPGLVFATVNLQSSWFLRQETHDLYRYFLYLLHLFSYY